MTVARWAAVGALGFLLYFALQGGEYGTTDLLALRRQAAAERAQVERLTRAVDSLQRAATAIERDRGAIGKRTVSLARDDENWLAQTRVPEREGPLSGGVLR